MKKTKANVRHLTINREIVRTLRDGELAGVAAGWECSTKTSGNILCSQSAGGDSAVCDPERS
jgi:hypothetical protein